MKDIYDINQEAGVLLDLQQQHYPNLHDILGKCLNQMPYLMVTQVYGMAKKSFPWNIAIEWYNPFRWYKKNQEIVDAFHCIHKASWILNDIKVNNLLMHSTPLKWTLVVINFKKTRPGLVYQTHTHTQSPESNVFSRNAGIKTRGWKHWTQTRVITQELEKQ